MAKKQNNQPETVQDNKPNAHEPITNELSSNTKKTMVTRIISSIVGLAIIIPVIFLGDWIFFIAITIFLAIASWEILGCARRRTVFIFIVYFLFIALITYWPLLKTLVINGADLGKVDNYYQSIYLSVLVISLGIFLLFGLTVIYKDFTVQDASFLLAMGVLIGLGFQSLFYLRYFPMTAFHVTETAPWTFTVDNTIKPSLLILFVIAATFLTDGGAYFVGVFFGKNKMNERISPKKTWEGFVGGIVISFVLSFTIAMIFAACNYPLHPSLTLDKWYYILALSLLIPVFATLGDFVFSSIKRAYGIKDYGALIPGHGGVLDRLDSVFFAAIISAVFIFMLTNITESTGLDWSKFLV